jgi:hypothetical protein
MNIFIITLISISTLYILLFLVFRSVFLEVEVEEILSFVQKNMWLLFPYGLLYGNGYAAIANQSSQLLVFELKSGIRMFGTHLKFETENIWLL